MSRFGKGNTHGNHLTLAAAFIAVGCDEASPNGELEYANSYGEPGYDQPAKDCGVMIANWNEAERTLAARYEERGASPEKAKATAAATWRALERRLEAQGYKLEWSDEWYIDWNNGGKAYRTQADSHGWESRLRHTDGDVLTPDDDADKWVADALNKENSPLPSWFDDEALTRNGFKVWEQRDRQVGFHPGQNETPDRLRAALAGFEFVIQVTQRSQFEARYRVWTRKEVAQFAGEYCEYLDLYYVHKV